MNYTRYEFKMYIGQTKDIMCFKAYVVDDPRFKTPSIDILKVENFGIHEMYKNLFYDIINGKLSFELMNKRGVSQSTKSVIELIEIDEGCPIKNLKKFEQYSKNYFGVTTDYSEYKFAKPFEFRYDGYEYNIGHGINIESYEQIEDFTKILLNCISANNTNFGNFYRKIEIAGSTVIPFESQYKDEKALKTIIKLFDNVNDNNVDIDSLDENLNKDLYINLIKKLPLIKKVENLHTFQIKIDDKPYTLDIDKAKKLNSKEFGIPVSYRNAKYIGNKYLKNNNKHESFYIEYQNNRITMYVLKDNVLLIEKLNKLKKDDLINITAETFSEKSILLDRIEKVLEKNS